MLNIKYNKSKPDLSQDTLKRRFLKVLFQTQKKNFYSADKSVCSEDQMAILFTAVCWKDRHKKMYKDRNKEERMEHEE
jgi:hypothetical protein